MMMKCWEFDPKDRPTTATIINKLTEIQLAGWDDMDCHITPIDESSADNSADKYSSAPLTGSSSSTLQGAYQITRAAWEYDDVKV